MKNMNNPLVSIVMATYNRGFQLEQTTKNIFEQSYSNIELIVINDGSTDDTLLVLQSLQSSFDFKIIDNVKNLGLQKSLNIGIQQASGKYIARIDDHDKWLNREKLSKQVAFLEANPEVGVIGTGYQVGDKKMINPISDTDIRKQILMRSPFCHVSAVMKKSIVDQVGGYDESLPYSEDWDLWLKIGRRAQLANLPEIMVAIQEEDLSLSGDYFLKQLPINRQIVKRYFKDYPGSFRAFWYHQFIRFFFAIVPLNSSIHRMMQRLFLKSFTLTSNRKTTDASID